MWEKLKKFLKENRGMVIVYCIALVLSIFIAVLLPRLVPPLKYGTRSYDELIEQEDTVPYEQFQKEVEANKVDTIYLPKHTTKAIYVCYNEETKEMSKSERAEYEYQDEDYHVVNCYLSDETIDFLIQHNVTIKNITDTAISTELIIQTLSSLWTTVLMITMFVFMLRFMTANAGGMGTFSFENLSEQPEVTFQDIIGHEEVADEFKLITTLIKDGLGENKLKMKAPRGILLEGPPGIGKTMLAKAIAHEANLPFLSVSGSDFVELFVGSGPRKVRQLFALAREHKPCIIFIDEIDSLGSRDGHGNHNEENKTINALLKEMDGFTDTTGIFVLAATNHSDKLDPAIKRAGRFDREITMYAPRDWRTRRKLFDHYLKDKPLSDDVDLDTLARSVAGFTGADVSAVCNEAAVLAYAKQQELITHAVLEEAIDMRLFKGSRSKAKASDPKDREIVAYHEAGHAVMSLLCGMPIARATIAKTTSGVGGAVIREDSDSVFQTKEEFRKQVKIAYAGRASEMIKFPSVTTGASNDITQATEMLASYIDRYGFDYEASGIIDRSVFQNTTFDETAIRRTRELSRELFNEAKEQLAKNYDMVEALAQKLLETESLTGPQINKFFEAQNFQITCN